jgi:beta-lactamase regulating signal transducer with metallopeptidase domain
MNVPHDANHWQILLAQAGPAALDAVLKSVLLLALAALVTGAMRRCSAAARHLVWLLAVAGLFALPGLSWTLPGWNILPRWMSVQAGVPAPAQNQSHAIAPIARDHGPHLTDRSDQTDRTDRTDGTYMTERPERPTTPTGHSANPLANASPAPQAQGVPIMAQAASPVRFSAGELCLAAWLAGFAVVLLRTVTGLAGLWHLERASRLEKSLSWLELLQKLARGLGLGRPVALLKSHRRRMPMTWGVLRPRLLLPETSEAWPEERRRVVLLHELAHAWRWDYATNLLTRLACAVWWFNPLVWLAARRMAAERERACDDIVLNHGANPAEYAEQLLEIAAGLRPGGWAEPAGIAMARPTKLEARLRAILDANRNRAALTRAAVFSALLILTVILIPVAMMKAAPASSNPQSPIPNPQSAKPPETILAELRNILPEDWTCTLNRKPGKVAWSEGQFKEPLFRIDFTNLNISFNTNPSPPHGLRGPPHPGLPLYFLPVTEEDRVHWENYGGSLFRRFAETPDYFVVTDPRDLNGGVFSVIGQRSVEPLFRALETYFGKLAYEKTGGFLRVHGQATTGLTSDSGFAGQAVDDQTGKPIKEFTLEFSTNDPTIPGGRLVTARNAVLREASTFFGGRFALEGRNYTMGPLPDIGLTFNGDQWWEKGQKVWPQVHAEGYLTEPMTTEPVVWPVKLTNLMVRLKRPGASPQPATNNPAPSSANPKSKIQNPQSNAALAPGATADGLYAAGFKPEKSEITVGEPIYLEFDLTNMASRTILLAVGGAQWGLAGPYRIEAFDAKGDRIPDMYGDGNHAYSQVTGATAIESGRVFRDRIYLPKFIKLENPGEITIVASRKISLYGAVPDFAAYNSQGSIGGDVQRVNVISDFPGDRGYTLWQYEITSQFELMVQPADPERLLKRALELVAGFDKIGAEDLAGNTNTRTVLGGNVEARSKAPSGWWFDTTNEEVRWIVKEISDIGDRRIIPELEKHLADPSLKIRYACVRALCALGEPLRPEWIVPLIQSRRWALMDDPETFAQEHGGTNAASLLIECMELSNPSATNIWNFRLYNTIQALHIPELDGPYNYSGSRYGSDPNQEGTPQEIQQNAATLKKFQDWLKTHPLPTPSAASEVQSATSLAIATPASSNPQSPIPKPQSDWGDAVEGVSVQLHTDRIVWTLGDDVTLKFSLRNQGPRSFSMILRDVLGELEVDGVWFHWVGGGSLVPRQFTPGQQFDNLPIRFTTSWQDKDGRFLRLTPGRHTIRYAYPLQPRTPISPLSNPVEIEVRTYVPPGGWPWKGADSAGSNLWSHWLLQPRNWQDMPGTPNLRTVEEAVKYVLNEGSVLNYESPDFARKRADLTLPSGRKVTSDAAEGLITSAFVPFGKQAIPALIELLDNDAEYARAGAFLYIQIITGRNDARYNPGFSKADRRQSVQAWRAWWEKNKDNPRLDYLPTVVVDAADWDAAPAQSAKSPETILAELRNILPEDWTCQLTLTPGAGEDRYGMGSNIVVSSALVWNTLFCIDFTNANISFANYPMGGSGWPLPPHPIVRLYFLPAADKSSLPLAKPGYHIGVGDPMAFAELDGYRVATTLLDINRAKGGNLCSRSTAPLGYSLEKYFGKFTGDAMRDILGITLEAPDGLTTGSGFAGQVVDDQTGKPVREFTVEYDYRGPPTNDPFLPSHKIVFFGGRFMLQFQLTDPVWEEVEFVGSGSRFTGGTEWTSGQKLRLQVSANGYLTEPMTTEPVVWPVKLTNVIVRLKRAAPSPQPATNNPAPAPTGP